MMVYLINHLVHPDDDFLRIINQPVIETPRRGGVIVQVNAVEVKSSGLSSVDGLQLIHVERFRASQFVVIVVEVEIRVGVVVV